MQISRRYSRAQLSDAVATSRNLREVCIKLGLAPYGANYKTLQSHMKREGLDGSHFSSGTVPNVAMQGSLFDLRPRLGIRQRPADFTEEELTFAVAASTSLAAAARRLAIKPGTTAYRHLRALISEYQLDTSHFLGQAWSRGRSGWRPGQCLPLEDFLVKGRRCASSALKERLIREGIKEHRCENCRRETWEDHPIPLELDHINGDSDDNRLRNLRILCPNCHALTDNYRGRNIGKRSRPGGEIGSTRGS